MKKMKETDFIDKILNFDRSYFIDRNKIIFFLIFLSFQFWNRNLYKMKEIGVSHWSCYRYIYCIYMYIYISVHIHNYRYIIDFTLLKGPSYVFFEVFLHWRFEQILMKFLIIFPHWKHRFNSSYIMQKKNIYIK